MSAGAIEIKDLRVDYGDFVAVNDISLSVPYGEVFGLVGPNGAGKTTLLKTLSKLLPLSAGSLSWEGADVTQTPAFDLAPRGVAYVPQEHNVFPDLSVAENLSIGSLVGTRSKEERLDEVYTLFPRLAERREHGAAHEDAPLQLRVPQ